MMDIGGTANEVKRVESLLSVLAACPTGKKLIEKISAYGCHVILDNDLLLNEMRLGAAYANPPRIYLNARYNDAQLVKTLAHEMAHIQQDILGVPRWTPRLKPLASVRVHRIREMDAFAHHVQVVLELALQAPYGPGLGAAYVQMVEDHPLLSKRLEGLFTQGADVISSGATMQKAAEIFLDTPQYLNYYEKIALQYYQSWKDSDWKNRETCQQNVNISAVLKLLQWQGQAYLGRTINDLPQDIRMTRLSTAGLGMVHHYCHLTYGDTQIYPDWNAPNRLERKPNSYKIHLSRHNVPPPG